MDINDIKHLAVERIFLIPDSSEGVPGYLWCDDPAPGVGMDASEAVEYVRKDVHEAHIAELEEREAALAAKLIEFHELANLANLMAAEDVCDALVSIDEKTPTDHLARHYLIKQVEALEGAADEFEVHERARQCLKWNAEKLRQQAEQC